MNTLDPTGRQRLAAARLRVEEAMHGLFHAGPQWDTPEFPPWAAARLEEMARVLMAEVWLLKQVKGERHECNGVDHGYPSP